MRSYFAALGYRVLVKDSIVIMSKEGARRKKKFPRMKLIRSLKIDCHRVAIKCSMCSRKGRSTLLFFDDISCNFLFVSICIFLSIPSNLDFNIFAMKEKWYIATQRSVHHDLISSEYCKLEYARENNYDYLFKESFIQFIICNPKFRI